MTSKPTSPGFERSSKRRKGYPSETQVKRGVRIVHGDGSAGLTEAAPFDAILAAASGPFVPDALKRQLAIGGRLVMPVGEPHATQSLVKVVRTGEDAFVQETLGMVRFVQLIGEQGWRD